jgi:hypothetical protein
MTLLEEELSERMSKILAEEIDWELLADIFVKQGWIMIDLPRFHDR